MDLALPEEVQEQLADFEVRAQAPSLCFRLRGVHLSSSACDEQASEPHARRPAPLQPRRSCWACWKPSCSLFWAREELPCSFRRVQDPARRKLLPPPPPLPPPPAAFCHTAASLARRPEVHRTLFIIPTHHAAHAEMLQRSCRRWSARRRSWRWRRRRLRSSGSTCWPAASTPTSMRLLAKR